MPPKKDTKSTGKVAAKKPAKSSGPKKDKKKKWSKGKLRDKLNNDVNLTDATLAKLYNEVPNYKLITPSIVSERLKITVSLARSVLKELCEKGVITNVVDSGSQMIYTKSNKILEADE